MTRYIKGKITKDTEIPGETIILNNGYIINPPMPRGSKHKWEANVSSQLNYIENFESYTEKHK